MEPYVPYNMKNVLTMAEGELIPRLNTCVQDEDINEWSMTAARIAGIQGERVMILKQSCQVCKNDRVIDYYFTGSGQLDVYIEALVFKPGECFAHIGANLSDLQLFSSDRIKETKEHMVIDKYVQEESVT